MDRSVGRVPGWGQLLGVVVLAGVFPLLTSNEYYQLIGFNVLVFSLLALGLNVVVGWGGLLDLGYVAFFGIGAYTYAFLSSDQFDIHLPTILSAVVAVVVAAIIGLLVGLPSRRLVGDYLAIVTLFFLQIFVTLATNATAINFPLKDGPVDLTGGPNGIANLDPYHVGRFAAETVRDYYYVALGFFVVVLAALHFVSESRTGRAWRALREDPLAAEAMGIPVNRLKLMAFMFGAAVAGLTGTIFGAQGTGVFPQDFALSLLITVYACVILGGAGSIPGVVLGATIITVSLEVLREANEARVVFYALVLLAVIGTIRPWQRLAVTLAGTVAFGLVVHLVVDRVWERGTAGSAITPGRFRSVIEHWVLLPGDPKTISNVLFVVLIALVLLVSALKGWWRIAALVPTIYLSAIVCENLLLRDPSATRFLLLGALLVALMNARPQGLLGTSRVEIA